MMRVDSLRLSTRDSGKTSLVGGVGGRAPPLSGGRHFQAEETGTAGLRWDQTWGAEELRGASETGAE